MVCILHWRLAPELNIFVQFLIVFVKIAKCICPICISERSKSKKLRDMVWALHRRLAPEQSPEIFRLFIVEVDEIWPPCRAINSLWNKIWFSAQVYWIMNLFTRKATSSGRRGPMGGNHLAFAPKLYRWELQPRILEPLKQLDYIRILPFCIICVF